MKPIAVDNFLMIEVRLCGYINSMTLTLFGKKIRMHNKFLKLNNYFCSLGIIDWFQGLIFRSFTGTFCFQGPPNNHGNCETCYGKFRECPGHFGYLTLTLPVYHAGYLANVVNILKCICKVIDLSLIFLNSLFQTSSFLQCCHIFSLLWCK